MTIDERNSQLQAANASLRAAANSIYPIMGYSTISNADILQAKNAVKAALKSLEQAGKFK